MRAIGDIRSCFWALTNCEFTEQMIQLHRSKLTTTCSAWQVNTELRPLAVEDVKKTIAEYEKKPLQPKLLWEAYKVAAKGHDLEHYKQMLAEHEQLWLANQQELAEEERKREEAEAKKTTEEDVEMPDADAEPKKKKAAKRKAPKEEDVDEEGKVKVSLFCRSENES